jgi:uncharacterized protein
MMIQQSTIDNNSAQKNSPVGRILEDRGIVLVSRDGKSKIKQAIISSRPESGANEKGMAAGGHSKPDDYVGDITKPVLIVGFPGTGLLGSICANYIIEKKTMHQIASVDSEYIIPAAIYIGGKLRHPFRIYADDKRALCVIVCEAPLRPEGIHSVMELVVTWASTNRVREVLVLDGVPVRQGGLPNKHRKPMVLSSSSPLPSSSSSSSDISKDDGSVGSAIMMGVSGGLISACLSDEIPCTGVVIPSTVGIPDQEGAAMLLETVSEMPSVPLEIDVEPLKKQGQAIKRQLTGFMDSVRKEQDGEEGKGRYLRSSRIYG